MISRQSRRLAGILLVVLPTVIYGGVSLLRFLIDRHSGYMDNPLRQNLFRAGHAHAGVLLVLSLVALRYVDETRLSEYWKQFVRHSIPSAAILLPAAFFFSVLSPQATKPNGFSDTRWTIEIIKDGVRQGGLALNYAPVVGLHKERSRVVGTRVEDRIGGGSHEVRARSLVNATGVFADKIRQMDRPEAPRLIHLSKGTHLVFAEEDVPLAVTTVFSSPLDGRLLFLVKRDGCFLTARPTIGRNPTLTNQSPRPGILSTCSNRSNDSCPRRAWVGPRSNLFTAVFVRFSRVRTMNATLRGRAGRITSRSHRPA